MKKIFIALFVVLLLVSCSEDKTNFIYTVTEFETIWDENNLNDHFNTKQARNSNVYEVEFENRGNFERKLITTSDEKIVYHDFCKVWDIVYAVWWKFGKEYWTARLRQVYPYIENNVIFDSDEIRIRDCEYIEENWKKYLWMVTHWEGKFILYDIENKQFLEEEKSNYQWTIDWKSYTWVTMIHEVVSADLDNNWKKEFYYTVTSENWTTNIDQRWKIFKVEIIEGKIEMWEFYDLWEAYSKEVHKIILKNWKEVLISSIQWKTEINEEKDKEIKPIAMFKFKDWTEKVIKDIEKVSDIVRPTVLKAFYTENGKQKNKELWEILTSPQCRVMDYGNLYKNNDDEINLIVWCNNGEINIYWLDNNLNLILKEELFVEWKQVHSFYVKDTDNNWVDEVFVWIDFDWLYHLDLTKEEQLFKMYDYTWKESWLWAIEGI